MIKIIDKTLCSGCTACESVCSHDAITMVPDEMGFLFPSVDESKCVDCGLCDKVCSFNKEYDKSDDYSEPFAFAARQKNIDEVMKSRSGGIFIALGRKILQAGGVVYGAAFKENFVVNHRRVTTEAHLDLLRGSKYVQSNLREIYRLVRDDLRNGYPVLFSGTPCQVSGLRRYLKILRVNDDKLLTCDIICHGVPSPLVWHDSLEYIEEKYGMKVIRAEFRDKTFGWTSHLESYVLASGKKITSHIFTEAFYRNIMMRTSCSRCFYTNLSRVGDITLGDFWGYEKTDADINKDNKGVSLVLVNTKKGLEFFDKISNEIESKPALLSNCMQPNLKYPSVMDPMYKQFIIDYTCCGFEPTMKKYAIMGYRYHVKKFMDNLKGVIWRFRKKFRK